jgi:hypothetical protein
MNVAPPYVLDRYVIDSLMRDLVGHDRRPSAYLVYLSLWAASGGSRALMSLSQLAEQTGLSKRGVQDAVRHLAGRGLVTVIKAGPTETPRYQPLQPWRRPR